MNNATRTENLSMGQLAELDAKYGRPIARAAATLSTRSGARSWPTPEWAEWLARVAATTPRVQGSTARVYLVKALRVRATIDTSTRPPAKLKPADIEHVDRVAESLLPHPF